MQAEKEFLKDKGIVPFISFKDGGEHTVVLKKSKIDSLTDTSGKEVEGIKYLVLENEEPKSFFTSSLDLISKLSDYPEDTKVSIQMKKKKGSDGQFKSYYEVEVVSGTKTSQKADESVKTLSEEDIDESNIPIINSEFSSEDIPF